MTAHEEHAAALVELQSDSPATFRWRDRDWTALVSAASRSNPLVLGGFSTTANLTLTVLFAQFADDYLLAEDLRTALMNSSLSYRGNTYNVDSVTVAPGGFQLRLEASDANERA